MKKISLALTSAFVGLCVLAGTGGFWLSVDSPPGAVGVVAVVAFIVAATLLWLQARVDLDAVLMLVPA